MTINDTIYDLTNEAYHHEKPYTDYLSSSQLKLYSKSPLFFRYTIDNPQEEKSEALKFGSLFHLFMELASQHHDNSEKMVSAWRDAVVVFSPPINERTGLPYGSTTKVYAEAYEAVLGASGGRMVITQDELTTILSMATSLCNEESATSKQVMKLLKWGKAEVSHFVEYEGCKFKYRPDLETRQKMIDWKTIATDDLSERSINNIIAKYGYDISAAFYQFMEHQRTGVWKQFYWVFVSKVAPYDCVMVDSTNWTYKRDEETDIVFPQVGAIKMQALLDMHIKCTKENKWEGAEIFIPEDGFGNRIMTPTPPTWEINNAATILENSFNS